MDLEVLREEIDAVAEQMDADIIIYSGAIKWPFDEYIIDYCQQKKTRTNLLLILSTYGGHPDAAYRIARCLQQVYHKISGEAPGGIKKIGDLIIYVDSVCKSAGTLICLGADKIIMSENGELGPLDTQLNEKHEVGERTSGLTPIQAVDFLVKRTSLTFNHLFNALRFSGPKFSTKIAADVATQLTIGILTPLTNQVDPIRLAEVERSLRIADLYGNRLKTDNLKQNALEFLIQGYPSHGFVIDRQEAGMHFYQVEEPSEELRTIGKYCSKFADSETPHVFFASNPKSTTSPTEYDLRQDMPLQESQKTENIGSNAIAFSHTEAS